MAKDVWPQAHSPALPRDSTSIPMELLPICLSLSAAQQGRWPRSSVHCSQDSQGDFGRSQDDVKGTKQNAGSRQEYMALEL